LVWDDLDVLLVTTSTQGSGSALILFPIGLVWFAVLYVWISHGLGRDFAREGPAALLDHHLEQAEDEHYREVVAAEEAHAGPAPTRRQRALGRLLTASSVVFSVLACVVYVSHLGMIPIVLGLVTILAGIHAGQLLPGHLARRQAKRHATGTGPAATGYTPVS
jgi:hypothetical protein